MPMTQEQIKDRLNEAIDEIVDAVTERENAVPGQYRFARQDYEATRKRVMDALIEIYVG